MLTWALGSAVVVTSSIHAFVTGDYVTIAGASPDAYNGKVRVTVTGDTGFTYTAPGPLTTPATGSPTATYASDTHGGKEKLVWRTLFPIRAELLPERTFDHLDRRAIEDGMSCRFCVRARSELVAGQRVEWTPSWPPRTPARTFLIRGVELNVGDPRWSYLVCEQVTL
jgi:hypothetical protein